MIVHFIQDEHGQLHAANCIYFFDPRYRDEIGSENDWIELNTQIPHQELHLDRCPDTGTVRAWHRPADGEHRQVEIAPRLAPMRVDAPRSLQVDVEAAITGIPPGARIMINDAETDIMDDSGILEVTPSMAGLYRFKIEADGYITFETSLEAHA